MTEMATTIRRAQLADLDQLAVLWKELADLYAAVDAKYALASNAQALWREGAFHRLEDDNQRVLLAETDGVAVGFIVGVVREAPNVFLARYHGHITDIFVTGELRRRGIGRKLYQALAEWFRERDVAMIDLNVAAASPAAQAFWRNVGFTDWMLRLATDL